MSRTTSGPLRHWRAWVIVGLAASAFGKSAVAQLYTPDPYDRTYRGYAYPSANDINYRNGGGPAPGQARIGAVAPNQMDRLDEELGLSSRYDSAFRRFDRDFDRQYVPNRESDKKYYQDRERREREMIRAMTERDPQRRNSRVREAEDGARRGASDLSLSPRRVGSVASAPSAPTRRSPRTGGPAAASSAPPAPVRRSRPATSAPTSGAESPRDLTTPAPSRTQRRDAGDSSVTPPAPTRRSGRAPSAAGNAREPLPTDVLRRARETGSGGAPPTRRDPAAGSSSRP